jgi:hypothetical protein
METTDYLRRQAAFCLRLSELCSDKPIADHLRFKAADYHQRALRAEFESDFELWRDGAAGYAGRSGASGRH